MIRAGLIGFGTVGTGVLRILKKNRSIIAERVGEAIEVVRVADQDLKRNRGISLNRSILTKNPDEILNDPGIPIVIELIGGIEPAKSFILKAIKNKKHVVTANKALLAEHGAEIFSAAAKAGVEVGFEASVAGGIPIIKAIREGLVGNQILSIYGIINGTSNYILTQMSEKGLGFQEALSLARKKGYAEADPSLDVDGIDAVHKLVILLLFSFGRMVRLKDIYTEGIRNLSSLDIEYAREFGYRVKLLAIARSHKGKLEARVHPTMVPLSSQLAMVEGAYNAVHISGDASGPLIFSGQGAGMMPAASAVVSDLADIAKSIQMGLTPAGSFAWRAGLVSPIEQISGRYYLRFTVVDKPGVLAQISRILGMHGISIAQVIQKGQAEGRGVPVVILTHDSTEKNLQSALKITDKLAVIRAPTVLLRIEDRVM